MEMVKQINIKNWSYYFYNDIIDLETFKSNLLKIDKQSYKDISIYNIEYITINKIDDCESISSVNPLYLRVTDGSGYIEEINGNKYLIFDSTNRNKELIKNTMMFWMDLKIKSRKYAMMIVIMKKITWKLNLILTIIYH